MAGQTNHSPPQRKLLDPSELGTKEYWDDIYTRELGNHAEDDEDEGTVWFSESNAEETVLRELDHLAEQGLLVKPGNDGEQPPSRFLDLGTGNGHMLFALRDPDATDDEPWSGELVGVDYSAPSIALAERIATQRSSAVDGGNSIIFETWDLLTQSPRTWLGDGFDVVLDKGTFDAISLMPFDVDAGGQHPCEIYRARVGELVKAEAFLFVTSCNWTRDELIGWLAPGSGAGVLEVFSEARYPSFTFGGKTGQSVVTVIFRKRGR